jgi:hypothetical protein
MPQGLHNPFLVGVVSAALSLVVLAELGLLVDPESLAPAVPVDVEAPVPTDSEGPLVRGRFLEEGSAAGLGSPAASGLRLCEEAPFVLKLTFVFPLFKEGLEEVVFWGIGRELRMVVNAWRIKDKEDERDN